MNKQEELICIVGPTAVGKTELSLKIAEKLNAEIVSVDSRQVYRFMDIGTAKPSSADRKRIRHHMIDVCDPDEPFNAGIYERKVVDVIADICKRGKTPLLVGGTGLYLKAVMYGLADSPPANQELRSSLLASKRPLHEMLFELDPEAAKKIHPNDKQKQLRALEVYHSTGKQISFFQGLHRFTKTRYNTIIIGLGRDRAQLYERIEQRVHAMIERGFVDEVEMLLKKSYGSDLTSMSSLGYSHVAGYLKNKWSLDEGILVMIRETKRYAKRQFTWFNKTEDLTWLDISGEESSVLCRIMDVIYERRNKWQRLG